MTDSTFRVADLAGAGDALRAGGERVPTWITKEAGNRRLPFEAERLQRSIDAVHAEFPQLDVSDYRRVVQAMVERKPSISADDLVDLLIREAESRVDLVAPEWEQFAARIYLRRLYKRASRNRFYDVGLKYGSYVGLQESLADRGIYSNDILRCYSKEELQQAGEMIDPERDRLFAYNGLYLLATRYLASDRSREVYELPQERWLTIALYLMQGRKPRERRMQLVGEAYWALSNLYMTVATPTLANAGKVGGQLSSCFIDTVDDSLQGIYDSTPISPVCPSMAAALAPTGLCAQQWRTDPWRGQFLWRRGAVDQAAQQHRGVGRSAWPAQGRGGGLPGHLAPRYRSLHGPAPQQRRPAPARARCVHLGVRARPVHGSGGAPRRLVPVRPARGEAGQGLVPAGLLRRSAARAASATATPNWWPTSASAAAR